MTPLQCLTQSRPSTNSPFFAYDHETVIDALKEYVSCNEHVERTTENAIALAKADRKRLYIYL